MYYLGKCLKFNQSECRLKKLKSQSEAVIFCAQSHSYLSEFSRCFQTRVLSRKSKVSTVDIQIIRDSGYPTQEFTAQVTKKFSLCHKLWFSNLCFIFANQCRRSQIFQTMNSAMSNNPSLRYQKLQIHCNLSKFWKST